MEYQLRKAINEIAENDGVDANLIGDLIMNTISLYRDKGYGDVTTLETQELIKECFGSVIEEYGNVVDSIRKIDTIRRK